MNNNKGFTLIELIFVIIILGIIIAFSLPNIDSSIDRNKKDTFLNDALDIIEKAKVLTAKNPAFLPADTEISIFSLNFIDKNEEIKESEYGLPYNRSYSFVTVKKVDNEYEYKISLLACNSTSSDINKTILQDISLLDDENKSISMVAARKGDNYIYYDKNKDGYINSDDVEESITRISKDGNNNIANQTCNNDNDYYRIEFASVDELNNDNKYSTVEELYQLNNINNKDNYFDEIIADYSNSLTKLKFYY